MCRPRPLPSVVALALSLTCLSGPAPATDLLPYHQLDPERKIVALTPGVTGAELADLLDRLEGAGYHVPVAHAGVGLALLDAPGIDAALAREARVTRVLRGPDPVVARTDERTLGFLRWWNEGFAVPVPAPEPPAGEETRICAGARRLSDVLAERGLTERCSPADYGRVHFAAGRVVVNLILPEYRGPSPRFWTAQEVSAVTSELLRALGWWNLKSGRRASFVLVDHGRVESRVNPAETPTSDEVQYIGSCLRNLGYNAGCGYTMVHDLNEAMRMEHGAHFAATQFILRANTFFGGGGALAYAYLGGPHTVALLGNGGQGTDTLDRVIAHEWGHIFQAFDEYSTGGGSCPAACTERTGYLNVPNRNCVTCSTAYTKCVMRSYSEYNSQESAQMETRIHPCRFTMGAAGFFDSDGDGDIDQSVLQTIPETRVDTVLADTLETPDGTQVLGEAWDQPYPAPLRYENPVTINSVRNVAFRISGGPLNQARAVDGFWSETREEFEIRLPALGGGHHSLEVWAVNTVGGEDPSHEVQQFFVYDVLLRKDLSATRDDDSFAVSWAVNGEDFDSTYLLHRRRLGGNEALLARIPARGGFGEQYFYIDSEIVAGNDYVYRLEVDIPNKGIKPLGTTRATAVLPPPPPGSYVNVAPNPSRDEILVSVTVPKGPNPGVDDVLPPPGGSPIAGSLGGRDDGSGPGGGAGSNATLYYRDAKLAIYDVQGRLVRDLGVERHREEDTFNLTWDGASHSGRPSPPGVYFLSVDFGYARETARLVLMR